MLALATLAIWGSASTMIYFITTSQNLKFSKETIHRIIYLATVSTFFVWFFG